MRLLLLSLQFCILYLSRVEFFWKKESRSLCRIAAEVMYFCSCPRHWDWGGGVSRAAKSLSFLSEMHFALIPWFIEVGTVSGSEEEMCAVAAVAKQRICLSVLEKILRLKNFSYLLDFGLCQSSESSVTLNGQQNFGRFFRSLLKQQTLVLDDQIVAVCACVCLVGLSELNWI